MNSDEKMYKALLKIKEKISKKQLYVADHKGNPDIQETVYVAGVVFGAIDVYEYEKGVKRETN